MLALRSRRRPPSRLRDDMDAFRQRRLSERRQNPSSGQGEAGAHAGAAQSGSRPEHRRFAQNLLTAPIRPTRRDNTMCERGKVLITPAAQAARSSAPPAISFHFRQGRSGAASNRF
jgi:hypothetical protein